ncbi:acyltransferase family protein [Sphingomonas canadensis]|uniref:Acyltransferase family protein n=1 Tax=Sphingomonas canadensis TaxID=1219257 RepID=A0ABW3H5E8_9SPHN|nr:acyltransferase family protein [Sphingomonas canadensis]MCW3836621.1 acyltransferase family protein [Sphingomonas canadensis]
MSEEAGTSASIASGQRHYGLDWLRIGAFGLLILYHIGMVFAPWAWVIHVPYAFPELIVPMALVTPWRLPLLFAVSGYASRHLFAKSGRNDAFLRSRAKRLLIPLAFGMAVIVPPEMWVLVREHGYPNGYLYFWLHDYLRWGQFWSHEFPSWEHLWFLAYLAFYTMLLGAAIAWRGDRLFAAFDQLAAWFTRGPRLLWVPVAALVWAKLSLMFLIAERQGLVTDWTGHALYMPCFLFGFMMGGTERLWPVSGRLWKPALATALAAGAVDALIEVFYPGSTPIGHATMALDRAARITMAWAMILVMFQFAQALLNHDHPWRATLAEAVFPFYIIHHPVIVLIVWYAMPLQPSALALFAMLLAGTLAAGTAFYLLGRRIRWLRPLIGLSAQPRAKPPAAAKRLAAG